MWRMSTPLPMPMVMGHEKISSILSRIQQGKFLKEYIYFANQARKELGG